MRTVDPTRTNQWLAEQLHLIHQQYFADVPVSNRLQVRFGRITKTRLGSITSRPRPRKGDRDAKPERSIITINGLLRDERVPIEVILAVLGHEFVHYTHGFHSPLPQLYRFPHQSGIVDAELTKRGMQPLLNAETRWTRDQFVPLYIDYMKK